MKYLDLRLAPAALLSLVTSALAAIHQAWALTAALSGAAAFIAVCAALVLHRRTRRGQRVHLRGARSIATVAALTLAITFIAQLSGLAAMTRAMDPAVTAAIESRRTITITGTVSSEPEAGAANPWTYQSSERLHVSSGSARYTVTVAPGTAAMGDIVSVTGVPRESGQAGVTAAFWDADATATGSDTLTTASARVRAAAREACAHLPQEVRSLVLGMVIGDTAGMPVALETDMQTTSLTHLTAVSGSHFAVITMALLWLLRRLTRTAREWVRGLQAIALAVAMFALTAVVLPEPSVLRALTMALAVALGLAWGRPARALPALSAGVIVLLVLDPTVASQVGLWLSVVAVVSIVLWSPVLAALASRLVAVWLARLISVPLAAWIACWPIIVGLNPGLGPYAVPANVLAVPSAAVVTLVGLAGLMAAPWWFPAAQVLMSLASGFAWPLVWVAGALSDAPGAWLPWPEGARGVALAALVSASLMAATAVRRLRPAAYLAATVAALVFAGGTSLWAPHTGAVTRDWAVVVCDVGQGDMALVRVADDQTVVIDTGPPGGAGLDCLDRYGVSDIALLVLTHPHSDHDGAVGEILSRAVVREAWVSTTAAAPGQDQALRLLRESGVPVSTPAPAQVWAQAATTLTVIPSVTVTGGSTDESGVNNSSIALWVSVQGFSVLAMGDVELDAQAALARSLGDVVVDLVKVPHHGSGVQDAALAAAITARFATVSVGADNPYGHPTRTALDLYTPRAELLLTTAECGDLALTLTGELASRCG